RARNHTRNNLVGATAHGPPAAMRFVARINSARRTEATGGIVKEEKNRRGFPQRPRRSAAPHRGGGVLLKRSCPVEASRYRAASANRPRSSSNRGWADFAPPGDRETRLGGDGSKGASRAPSLSRPAERATNSTSLAGTPGQGCMPATGIEETTRSYLALF